MVNSTHLAGLFREVLSKEVTFEKRPDLCEPVSYMSIWGNNVPGGERARVKT